MVATSTTLSLIQQSQAAIEAIVNAPFMSPPPGVMPTFINPPNINHLVIVTMVLCNTFAAFAVIIRIYTKLFLTRSTAAEDCKFCMCVFRTLLTTAASRCYGPCMGKINTHLRSRCLTKFMALRIVDWPDWIYCANDLHF